MQSSVDSSPISREANSIAFAPRLSLVLIALVALMAGVLAAGGMGASDAWLAVLIALVLTQVAWSMIWHGLAEVPWRESLHSWQSWPREPSPRPARTLPYTQPGSAAAKTGDLGGQFQAWASAAFWPRYGATVMGLVGAILVGLVLGLVLGVAPTLLTLSVIILAQVALFASRGSGQPAPLLAGLMWVSAPMMLGVSLFGSLGWDTIWAALGLGIAYAGISDAGIADAGITDAGVADRPTARWYWLIGGGLVLALLVLTRRPLGAFAVALLMLPQVLLQPSRRIRWWFIGVVLAVAVALS